MVSSYNIFTTISIPLKYVNLFNKYSSNFHPYLMSESIKTKSYYDAGYYPGGIKTFEDWLSGKLSSNEEPLKSYSNNWEAHEASGILFDNGEKFHGSVRVLDYMIKDFFNTYNIKLNGTVVGVNTEYNHLFVYEVVDNVITLNENLTRKYINEYKTILKEDYDDEMSHSDKMMYKIIEDLKK